MTTANITNTAIGSESRNTKLGNEGSLAMQFGKGHGYLKQFMSRVQLRVVLDACFGEEKKFFIEKVVELGALIDSMPKTYEQDGAGDDAIVSLHYFNGSSDWYITEKDRDGGTRQAFGFVVMNGQKDSAELGYVSIAELVSYGVELDLHFTPCKLSEVKAKRGICAMA